MVSLEIELILILVLSAVIGILMGRFLCKNGENEEREEKSKVIHAYKALKNELEINQKRHKEQSLLLKGLEDKIAEAEQGIENSQTKLRSSDKQRTQLLEELKVLEKYKPRFESLDREFKLQSKIVEGLKEEKIANQKEIADFKIMTNQLNTRIADFKSREASLESDIVNLNETIKAKDVNHKKSSVEEEQKLKERMHSKEVEYENLLEKTHKKYQAQLEAKSDSYQKLEEESSRRYKEMVQSKDKAYEKLEKSSLSRYKATLQSKNEAYEKLQEESSKKYKDMVKLKDDAYEELRAALDGVENEYEEFKLNYSLDSDRLDNLELDHQKIYHTLETVVLERDDLVARLRAISSVVGAVGIDGASSDKTQQLLENK